MQITPKLAIVTAIIITSVSTPAHAYVDPGSGSVIVTAILGFFAAISYTLRKQFYKLKNLFSQKDQNLASQKDKDM